MRHATLPGLSRELVTSAAFQQRRDVMVPAPALLDLPERAVQFGTGGFLRGFVEYFIDAANRQGRFQGRLVMIGSTSSGRDQLIGEQDGLYTLAQQGVERGVPQQEQRVIGVVSRALPAATAWPEVLRCARNPLLQLIFSNTTEIGITLDDDDAPELAPPRSFPGKLTRFLYERALAFDFDRSRGVVVLPCELIEQNGSRLRDLVLQIAARWHLDARFADWVREAVPFCNTLVDRIVAGTPEPAERTQLEETLGYRDDLLTVCELYRLFAIEADPAVRARLGFADADRGIIVTDDITPYRERKVRLLNGTHTAMVPVALLCGCTTVAEAMQHELVAPFVRALLFDDILPSLAVPDGESFAHAVIDRFANPYLRHALFDITLQGTMKLRVRVVPSILGHVAATGRAPASLAFAFAAYLLFMRGELHAHRRVAGATIPLDEAGSAVRRRWAGTDARDRAAVAALVRDVCADTALWEVDLNSVPGFAAAVAAHLTRAGSAGVARALEAHLNATTTELVRGS